MSDYATIVPPTIEEHEALKGRANALQMIGENLSRQIETIKACLTHDNWYDSSMDKSDILDSLCEILGYEPKASITISARVSVRVSMDVPLAELEDFDAEGFLADELSVDISNGDAILDSWDVDYAEISEE